MIYLLYKRFVDSYVQTRYKDNKALLVSEDEMVKRIQYHQYKMPDFMGLGIQLIAVIFLTKLLIIKVLFSSKSMSEHISVTRHSKFSLFRNFIRFHDSLFEVANVSEKLPHIPQNVNVSIIIEDEFDFIIIGSGPGGSVSARKLQIAGFNSCIIESGRTYPNGIISPFSYGEMLNQYKHGGITATLGNSNITYVEGFTLGGGSEINSGLYHRTPSGILQYWKNEFDLIGSESDDLDEHFLAIENDLCISYFPNRHIPAASLKLKEGAEKLGWDVQEVPRWFKYNNNQNADGQKMTMSQTYLKHYLAEGGKCYELASAKMIKKKNDIWDITVLSTAGEKHLLAKNVILAAGTINTPQLLKQSGISRISGNRFKMHPTLKVVALFDEKINRENMGVPVHQVKEFSPEISFGCSISSKPYLRVSMLDHFEHLHIVEEKWENMAIYYVMIVPEGYGSIHTLPYFKDPLVRYNLTGRDKNNLARGLKKLCELLNRAGARKLFPSIQQGSIISTMDDIKNLPESIDPQKTSLMTIHLFSSCPIGERQDRCVANSYGKVFGHEGLFISDGSMLPSAPGVNPQGTIMAFAHRNIEKIIAET